MVSRLHKRRQPRYEICNAGVEGRIAGSSPAATPAYLAPPASRPTSNLGLDTKRAGPPRPALFSLVRTPVPPRGSEVLTPLTGGLLSFFRGTFEPIESVLTRFECGHLARDANALEVGKAVPARAYDSHLAAEV